MQPATTTSSPTRAPSAARATIAIAGNPNTGKTTLFNRLSGSGLRVGNYPGITVERTSAEIALPSGRAVEIVDVPGAYSLSARSREEEIAIQEIAGLGRDAPPDVVLLVVDASALSRNLYLVLQVIELDVPVVVALNMADLLEKQGLEVDRAALQAELGVPVVTISALRDEGFGPLLAALDAVIGAPRTALPGPRWTPQKPELRADVEAIVPRIREAWPTASATRADALALWALLSLDEHDELHTIPPRVREIVAERRALAAGAHRQVDAEVITGRYGWIDARLGTFVRARKSERGVSERIDGVLLNPWLGFPLFLLAMGVVFQSLFSWADPAIGLIETVIGELGELFGSWMPEGLLHDFVQNALIAGVGSVVVFVPQIVLLFLFIGVMEDSGYMARVAVLMDRLMRVVGLHGRAFVPMLSGYACAVPAILATRTMERQRDRLLTMMVLPLMSCSARLPVYGLIIAALFPAGALFGAFPVQGLLMVAMYAFSTLTALAAAAVLSRTLFKAPRVPLIQELPPYRMPHWPSIALTVWLRLKAFLTSAGTVILACTVILWALLTFPRDGERTARFESERAAIEASLAPGEERDAKLADFDARRAAVELDESYAGRVGRGIEPALAPLGFDWKIGIGLVGAFAAREVFVSTMGVVYGVGGDVDEGSTTLREKIREEKHADGRSVFTPLVGLSLMVFFALACQCMSTLAAVYRETKTWKWPAFLFVYMTVLAWIASFAVYQGGRALGFE